MSSIVVLDDHNDLLNIGDLSHDEIDTVILNGEVPPDRTINVALLPADNTFTGDTNTFDHDVVIAGTLTVGTLVENLNIEDTIICLGQGAEGGVAVGDRGLIFTSQSLNSAFYWDHSAQEFRLASVDADCTDASFPESTDPGFGNYLNLKLGTLTVSGSLFALDVDGDPVNYLERYVKAGSGISVDPDLGDSGAVIISVNSNNRQKEIKTPGEFLEAGELLLSDVISSKGIENVTSGNLDVFVNGVLLASGSGNDYFVDPGVGGGPGIIFGFNLESDDKVTIIAF